MDNCPDCKKKDEALRKAEHGLIVLHNLDASDDAERLFRNPFVIDNSMEIAAVQSALALTKDTPPARTKCERLFLEGGKMVACQKPKGHPGEWCNEPTPPSIREAAKSHGIEPKEQPAIIVDTITGKRQSAEPTPPQGEDRPE